VEEKKEREERKEGREGGWEKGEKKGTKERRKERPQPPQKTSYHIQIFTQIVPELEMSNVKLWVLEDPTGETSCDLGLSRVPRYDSSKHDP
jgi:hypothetical protein